MKPNRQSLGAAALLAMLLWSMLLPAGMALNPDKKFQDYVSDTWSIEQGLPQITVLSIAQDHTGYMWLGTQDGLARFDGLMFKNYLSGMWVQALAVGDDNTVWIGTNKGLAWYRDQEIHTLVDSQNPSVTSNRPDVRALAFTSDGRLLAATDQGLLQVDAHGFNHSNLLPRVPLFSLLNRQGSLWVGGVGKLYIITASQTRSVAAPGGDGTLITHLVAYNSAVWVGTNRGLFRYSAGKWQRADGDPAQLRLAVSAMNADSDGNFRVANNIGLARLRGNRMVGFVDGHTDENVAQLDSMFEDREGSFWLGSHAHGVMRLWDGYTRRYSTAEGLRDPLTWSLTPDLQGGIWVGTSNGVYRLDKGRFQSVLPGDRLPAPKVYTLLDRAGTLWIGTSSGVALYRAGHVVTPRTLAPLNGFAVEGLLQTHDGSVWIASMGGLFKYANGSLTQYGAKDGLADVRCRVLFETSDGRLLVGTLSGLYEFSKGRFLHLATDTHLRDAFVTAIAEPRAGELVVGSFNEKALYLFDGKRWHELTDANGLPLNTPTFMTLDDSKQWLWVAGIRGLYRTHLADLEALAASQLNALPTQRILNERGAWPGSAKSECCNGGGNAHGFLAHGELWLPTTDGVISVNTQNVHMNQVVPNTVIEAVEYDGNWHPLIMRKPLQIQAYYRDVSFRFSVLSFQNPRSVVLRYRLHGFEDTWHELSGTMERVANYPKLPPGQYVFEVRGSNNAGIWDPNTASFAFSIERHFYETWWFQTLAVLLLLLLVYLLYRWRVHSLSAQRQYLEQVVTERTEALQSLNRQLEEASQTDPLTGLKNRRYLAQQLPKDLAHFRRELKRPENHNHVMVFAVADLDHFKEINDSAGHFAGDELLKQVAGVLVSSMRFGHYVVRWGGEEFLIVFRPMPRGEVTHVVARVQNAVANTRFKLPNGEQINITCSMGFSEFPFLGADPDAVNWESLVNIADNALYAAKAAGRNCWLGLRPGTHFAAASLKHDLAQSLDAMLDADKLVLVNTL